MDRIVRGVAVNILFLESDLLEEYNCSNYRVMMPARALRRAGQCVEILRLEEWVARTDNANKIADRADIIILQRNLFAAVLSTVMYWRAQGKTIVADLDDAYKYMTIGTGSPSYDFWINGIVEHQDTHKPVNLLPHPLDCLDWGVKLCGSMSSPSKLICEDWKSYVPTYHMPNYLESKVYKWHDIYKDAGQIYIGWGGSATHLGSWRYSGIKKALWDISKKHKNTTLVVTGDPRVKAVIDFQESRRVVLGWIPHILFSERLSRFDIGLIPLEGEYDRRRSWLKSAEYTLMGIPWVGSDLDPNRELQTGTLVENTEEAWFTALDDCITNLVERKAQMKELQSTWVSKIDIDDNVNNIIKVYETIVQKDKK